jgi:protein-S-isoprenylcysteine O-methyltransferase Ste14
MALFLTTFAAWAAVHSLLASNLWKRNVRRVMGEGAYNGLYRLVYNVLALVTFVPVLYLGAISIPDEPIWRVPAPILPVFVAIQIVGVVGLLVALFQTDALSFGGIRQAKRFIRGESEPDSPETFVTNGAYGIVRHPLYLFSLLVLWFAPVMTLALLVLNIASTLYFWLGSIAEERRLVLEFGEQYIEYRRRVPRLIPIRLPRSS